jgi:uncharacterized protein YjiS (DUF1127 family)
LPRICAPSKAQRFQIEQILKENDMSAYDTNRTLAQSGFARLATKLFVAIATWNDVRQTRNELAKLSDRELDDIGLSRGDIDRIAARV